MECTKIYELLERIGNLLRTEERRTGLKYGLQPVHIHALYYLSICNQFSNTPAIVTEYLGLTKGTVSQTLNLLERKSLIRREPDYDDKRKIHLIVTQKGIEVVNALIPPKLMKDVCREYLPNLVALEEQLILLLTAIQKQHDSRSFGVCRTCRYFRQHGSQYQCGLTGQSLVSKETGKICREHETVSSNSNQKR